MTDEVTVEDISNMTEEEKEEFLHITFAASYQEIQDMYESWEEFGIPLITSKSLPAVISAINLACFSYNKYVNKYGINRLH